MYKPLNKLLLCSLILSSNLLFAADTGLDSYRENLSQAAGDFSFTSLDADQVASLNDILNRQGDSFVRPESCPLNSTDYADILSSIENVKSIFKDPSCLNDNTELKDAYDSVVSTGSEIQETLAEQNINAGEDAVSLPTQVNGVAINSMFSSINGLFFQSSCELNDANMLERSADLIQNFAQMGLLISNSNGLVISGGGLALSSILRLLNNLFTKKFDFEDNSERASFIKLNCAFYDIRRDIEQSGLTDIALPEHSEDLASVKILLDSIEKNKAENTKRYEDHMKFLAAQKAKFIEGEQGELKSLESNIAKALEIVSHKVADEDGGSTPAETVKKEMLTSLLKVRDALESDLTAYIDQDLSQMAILDLDLVNELKKLDLTTNSEDFMELFKMEPSKFNSSYRASLLFHFQRVQDDLTNLKAAFAKKWDAEKLVNGQTVAEYSKSIKDKLTASEKAQAASVAKLDPIKTRLGRIVGADNGYTRNDDGTENKTAILSSYDEIANQIYGKWGYEFLKYTTKTAKEDNDSFKEKFSEFANAHLNEKDGVVTLKNKADLSELRVLYACQDAKPLVRRWTAANSLVQQGYDFVATNKELFHADHPGTFLGDITKIRSVFEKIQDHHKSSIFAQKIMKGEEVSESNQDKYLGKKAKRKKFLGTVMLAVEGAKSRAQMLQKLNEDYDCTKLTTLDD